LPKRAAVTRRRTLRSSSASTPDLPPEVIAQAIEQVLHRHYANWADETIPALDGRTPRQAITTPAGLERVKGLLREYEDGERQQSAAQGRPAVSYQFLVGRFGDLEVSTDGTPSASRGDDARVLTIDLEELTWALNSRDPLGQSSHWLNIESGTILSLIGPDADDEADEDPRDDDRWLFIEPIESSEAFRVMEDFVDQCGDDRLARALGQALQQRKPFRRFKDTAGRAPGATRGLVRLRASSDGGDRAAVVRRA
jgi:hypothetical protein